MKSRIFLVAALILCAVSSSDAVEVTERYSIATITVSNEDSIPHSVTVDENNRTIRVFAKAGGSTALPPRQDFAMRLRPGVWRVFGDSGREMQVRLHHGRDYTLHMTPYVHGNIRTLVGVIDDGYNHFKVPLLDMREHPHFNDYPSTEYDPNFHGDYRGDDGYQYYRTDSQESLGHAIHQAFDQFLHNMSDQQQPTSPW